MPAQDDAEEVLADWRAVALEIDAVNRRIVRTRLLFAELDKLHAEATRLRDEYGRLLAEIGHRSVPPAPLAERESDT